MSGGRRVNFQFCGFGGQGLVLSATVLGTAAVRAGLNGVQTQSYGSEARGGECQAELSIAEGALRSPSPDQVDVLIAMSQAAYDRYAKRLRPGGVLLVDPQFVATPSRSDVQVVAVPVTQVATEQFGMPIVANMVLLGFLRQATGIVPEDALNHAIRDSVPEKFVETNLRAAACGKALAVERNRVVEV
ncbi:MAG: 2-oxoacid:acceptor oxidoreductase family protein [Thermotogota bacterium]